MQPPATYDQAATETLGADIAARLRPGDAILLEGPLGAGKTTLARALIRAACQNSAMDVPSPSYTLVQSYATPQNLTLSHFDLWRLDGPDALAELGWDDATQGIVIVEWPDRLRECAPENALIITMSLAGEGRRFITLKGWEARLRSKAGGTVPVPPDPPALLGRGSSR